MDSTITVADLTKTELRRIVEILQISHPDAVSAAMDLVLQTRRGPMVQLPPNDESDDENDQKGDIVEAVSAAADTTPASNDDVSREHATSTPSREVQEHDINAIVIADEQGADVPIKNARDEIGQQRLSADDVPIESPADVSVPMPSTCEIDATTNQGEIQQNSSEQISVAMENQQTHGAQQMSSPCASSTNEKQPPPSAGTETRSSEESLNAATTATNDEECPPPTTETEPSADEMTQLSLLEPSTEASRENATDKVSSASDTETNTANQANASPHQPQHLQPQHHHHHQQQQQQQQQPKGKKKKRPPGKKRPPKPSQSTENNDKQPEYTTSTVQNNNESSIPNENDDNSASKLMTETSAVSPLCMAQNESNDTTEPVPVSITVASIETFEASEELPLEVAQIEKTQSTSSSSSTSSSPPQSSPVAQNDATPTAPVILHDGKEQDDMAPNMSADSGAPKIINISNEQEPNNAVSEQPSNANTDATTTKSQKKTKKRPPNKKRASISEKDDDDTNNNSQAQPITRSEGSKAPVSESAAASGTMSHEVIPWKNERMADNQDDEEDLAFYSFDGYSSASATRPYENLSAEDFPDAGCYLVFDSQGGGKLVLHYSKTRIAQAIAFYSPGPGYSIQAFKFTRNHGRVELIGNIAAGLAGKRNYYSGFCQFIRAAKDVNGTLWIFPPTNSCDGSGVKQGLNVDIYVYLMKTAQVANYSVQLPENQPCCVSEVEAVACLPKNADFFSNVRVDLSKWLDDGNAVGSTIQLHDGKKEVPSSEGLFIPGLSSLPAVHVEPSTTVSEESAVDESSGCYLVYDKDGCKLIQHYSKTRVPDAIGFFAPGAGQKFPGFKFKSNQGRSELIGNCSGGLAGRKNYFNGICQFVRAAKAIQGTLSIYPRTIGQAGLDVDIYVYTQKPEAGAHQTVKLTATTSRLTTCNVSNISGVACLPKHTEFFDGLTMDLTRWVEEGSNIGAALQL